MSKNQETVRDDRAASDRGTMLTLAALAAASAGWAVFLWRSLIAARQGAEPFCVFGASDCAALWDGPFAAWIHRMTGVPVAGWGLVWGLVALALPLLVLLGRERLGPLRELQSAIKLTAVAGALGVVVLLAASQREGAFCSNCAITYTLTGLYAAVAFLRLPRRASAFSERGAFTAALLTVLAYALLLYPGTRTPRKASEAAREAMARAAEGIAATPQRPEGAAPRGPAAAVDEAELVDFLSSLPDQVRSALSTTLALYRNAPARPSDPPRAPEGNPAAAVVIAEFIDFLCSHCADLHETMRYLLDNAGSRFTLDSRNYPLDGNCNARLPARGAETVRCLAAKVSICAERSPNRFEMAGELFAEQRRLTTEKVLEVASRHLDQMSLDACLSDPATERKLASDVAFAGRHDPEGTPLVLVNGRQATPYGPLLLALVLAQGDADHPAFGTLPPPAPVPVP